MELFEWQKDLRFAGGYDGSFDYENLRNAISSYDWTFQSVVKLPEKRDPDWPLWAGRATKGELSISSRGDSDVEALGNLLLQIIQVELKR